MKHILRLSMRYIIISITLSLGTPILLQLITKSDIGFMFIQSIVMASAICIISTLAAAGNQKHCIDELLGPDHDNNYSVNQKKKMLIGASVEDIKSKIVEQVNLKKDSTYQCETIGDTEEISWVLRAKKYPRGKKTKSNKDKVFITIRGVIRDSTEVMIHSKPCSKYHSFDNGRNLERILKLEKEFNSL